MTKAKVGPRGPVAAEVDEGALPEAWRGRAWAPILIVAIVVGAVLGAGLLADKALEHQVPAALAGCQTSTQIAPHEFLGPQPICITAGSKYQATVNTTQGAFVIQLYPQIAPTTVNNFIVLAIHGYYNGLTFWDAPDWEVQAGDPKGNGTGGPGYNLPEEPTPEFTWDPGAVGMARIPGGPINGSQFFIVKSTWPNGGPTTVYNRFGTVISGLDKVSAISAGDRINTVTITVSNPTASPSR